MNILTASFTVHPEAVPHITSCLDALHGVGVADKDGIVTVEVREPYGAERLDQVRGIIRSIDPSVTETA